MNKKILLIGILLILLSSFVSANLVQDYNFNSGSGNIVDNAGSDTGLNTDTSFDTDYPTFNKTGSGAPYSANFSLSTAEINTQRNQLADSTHSIAFFVKPSGSGSLEYITGGRTGSTTTYASLRINADDTFQFAYGQGNRFDMSGGDLSDSKWYSIVETRNGNTACLYIDNALISCDEETPPQGIYTIDLKLGNYYDNGVAGSSDFTGLIDNYQVYDHTLSKDEISLFHNCGAVINCSVTTPNTLEITAEDRYDNTSILNFGVNISNSTGTYELTTTNGSIFFTSIDDFANISLTSNYFNPPTFLNYNISADLQINITGTDLTFNFYYNDTSSLITKEISFNDLTNSINKKTSTGSLTTTPTPNESIIFNINADGLQEKNKTYTFSPRENNSYDLFLIPELNNITFTDALTGNPLNFSSVKIFRPNGVIESKTTDVNGKIQFNYIYDGSAILGNYTFEFGGKAGYYTPINFTKELTSLNTPLNTEFNITRANLRVNIYDRETRILLNRLVNIIVFNDLNLTTYNGTYDVQNLTSSTGVFTIQALSDGYTTEQQTFTYTNQDNATINLYLLNQTGLNSGVLYANVIDEFYRTITDANVNLYEYDLENTAYIKVSECQTNLNGECQFAIELNVKSYYLTADKTIGGRLYSSSTSLSGEIIQTTEEVRNLILRLSEQTFLLYTDYLTISISETFSNNISTIYIDFSTTDNFVTEVCVEYFILENSNMNSVYDQCVSSSSSYVATPVNLDRTKNYVAQVYQLKNSNKILLAEYNYNSLTAFENVLINYGWSKYFILFIWLLLISLPLMFKNLTFLCYIGIIWSWVELRLFPQSMSVYGSVMKTILLFALIFLTTKKEDT